MAQADRDPLIRGALVASAAFNLGAALNLGFPSSLGRLAGLPVARECLNEGAVVGEAGADAVALFDHGGARIVTDQRPCHLVATHMASAVAARYPRSRRGASRESASYPARRCLNAIFRARVEGDGRLRRHTMDGVDHRFKQN